MKNTIHIIEPTLADQTGHCYSYVSRLLEDARAKAFDIELWIDQRGKTLFTQNTSVKCHDYFSRHWRKWQAFRLYRHLLKTHDAIFIPTAGRLDMVILDKWMGKKSQKNPVFLHIHQFTRTASKIALLQKIARRRNDWTLMTPTEHLSQFFKDCGFTNVHTVPCPSYAPLASQLRSTFQRVLYAGAARSDKGFPLVVSTVALAQEKNLSTPFQLQCSPPESRRFDIATQAALKALAGLKKNYLTLIDITLDRTAYLQQFTGSICLLLYDTKSYRDKFSGVALDAICQGAPIITTPNTWIADTVKRYQVGMVLANPKPEEILKAIGRIRAEYTYYQDQCQQAAQLLQELHDPKHTWRIFLHHLKLSGDRAPAKSK